MRRAGSLIMSAGDAHKLPAGGALAVDRDHFSAEVTRRLAEHPLIAIERGEIAGLPPPEWDSVIIATGPLTSPALRAAIQRLTGESELAFFDAIAPIVHLDSIDPAVTWRQSRYDKAGPGGTGADYINCPMTQGRVRRLPRCAARGRQNLLQGMGGLHALLRRLPADRGDGRARPRHPALRAHEAGRPLQSAQPGERPHAVVQLRQDNALGTLWNMVGFQTKLKHGEQARVFRMIPGCRQPSSRAWAGCTATRSSTRPNCWTRLRLRVEPRLRFAGQITGCEGYVESAAIGLLAGCAAAAERMGTAWAPPPPTTAFGALLAHITGRPYRGGRRRQRRGTPVVPADERQLRPVPAAGGSNARRRRQAHKGQGARSRSQARAVRPRARRPRPLARRRSRRVVAARGLAMRVAAACIAQSRAPHAPGTGWARARGRARFCPLQAWRKR